jgi:hypothetical protein
MKKVATIMAAIVLIQGSVAVAGITSPDQISDLLVWLDARDVAGDGFNGNDYADGTDIATWVNKGSAGSAHDATQATGTKQANFSAQASWGLSRPTMTFNGSSDYYGLGTAIGNADSSDMTIIAVVQSTAYPEVMRILSTQNGGGEGWTFQLTQDGFAYYEHVGWSGSRVTVSDARDDGEVITVGRDNNDFQYLSVNYDSPVTNDPLNFNPSTLDITRVGSLASAEAGFFNGDMSMILIYERYLTDEELNDLKVYATHSFLTPEPSGILLLGLCTLPLLRRRK